MADSEDDLEADVEVPDADDAEASDVGNAEGPEDGGGDPESVSEPGDGGRTYDPDADHPFPDERLNEVLAKIEKDAEVQAYLEAQNVNPVVRKRYNDHGPKHVSIVRNRALCLYDLLKASGVTFNGAADQDLDEADEAVVVALAATIHDIGHVVHRDEHPYYSIPLAADLLDRFLGELPWYDVADVVRVKGEILHAILCHHTEETPLTLEAGVVRVGDALDMERGRSRIPYDEGGRGINTVSSQAIKRVSLQAGEDYPVLVEIEMTNAAGVYQVDNLLKAKLHDSGLEDLVRIVAVNRRADTDRIVERIEL
ncbi:MAG: HD domain-containing protein [Haloarculaceae archaeon]